MANESVSKVFTITEPFQEDKEAKPENQICPSVPFLPPIQKNKEYTLVLDLDETLIHYDVDENEKEGFYLIRPGALKFLYEMKYYFEVVVFTAAIPEVRYINSQ